MKNEEKIFDSEFGTIKISKTYIKYERNENSEWENIELRFHERELLDEIRLKDIERIELLKQSVYPNIEIITKNGEKKRLFMHLSDPVDNIFKKLRYNLNAHRQRTKK